MTHINSNNEFSAEDLISFLWKHRIKLSILGVLAAIISSVVSLVMEEKFMATVTLYPGKSSSVTFSENGTGDQSVTTFGEEGEAEQMLQILESSSIKNRIIEKYDLLNHYDVGRDSKFKKTELSEIYKDQINFERNNKGAVLIKVLDKSPDTAALIANDIAALFDSAKNKIIHERALLDFKIKAEKLKQMEDQLNTLRDTMSVLSNLGVVTYEAYAGLTRSVITAPEGKIKEEYLRKIAMTDRYGSLFSSFLLEIEHLSGRIATMRTIYQKAETDANANISHKFEVEAAEKPEKKAYPVRWIIVVISTFSTVFFSIVVLMFMEKFKELKSKF